MAHDVKRNDKSGGGVGTAVVGLLILLMSDAVTGIIQTAMAATPE